jgi:t-SNARE syntaxin family protein
LRVCSRKENLQERRLSIRHGYINDVSTCLARCGSALLLEKRNKYRTTSSNFQNDVLHERLGSLSPVPIVRYPLIVLAVKLIEYRDVRSLLQQTRTSFATYLRLRSLSPTSPEVLTARKGLSDNLSSLADDLTVLTAIVRAVEKDPYKYGLDVSDVARRRQFVEETTGEVEDIKEEMSKAEEEGAVPQHPKYGGFVGDDDDDDEAEDPVAGWEREQQVQMMREQDVQLEGVFRTVGNLRDQAHVMGRELGEQAEMIDAVDRDAERVQGKLGRGLKDLNRFIRKNEGVNYSPVLFVVLQSDPMVI